MTAWKKIKAEYIRGGISYKKICEKYAVSFSALRRRAEKEKWTELRTKAAQKSGMEIANAVARADGRREEMFLTISDKLLRMISDGIDDGSIAVTAKGLRDITGALRDLREIGGIKNPLDRDEQLARIAKLKKEADDGDGTDNIVTVRFEGENIDDYSR